MGKSVFKDLIREIKNFSNIKIINICGYLNIEYIDIPIVPKIRAIITPNVFLAFFPSSNSKSSKLFSSSSFAPNEYNLSHTKTKKNNTLLL